MSIGSDDDVRSSSTTSTVIIVSEVQTSKFVGFWLLDFGRACELGSLGSRGSQSASGGSGN